MGRQEEDNAKAAHARKLLVHMILCQIMLRKRNVEEGSRESKGPARAWALQMLIVIPRRERSERGGICFFSRAHTLQNCSSKKQVPRRGFATTRNDIGEVRLQSF